MRRLLFCLLVVVPGTLIAQSKVALNPTITPALFTPNDQITVTYNVTGTTLASLSSAYVWVWIPGENINAKYNVNPASSNPTLSDNAKCTKTVAGGQTTFAITFKPADFFASSIANETQMGILLKGNDWSNGQTTDFIANFGFKISLVAPLTNPVFVNSNGVISIQVEAPVASDFETFVDDIPVHVSGASATSYSYNHTASESSGLHRVKVVGTSGSGISEISFDYIIRASTILEERPIGIVPGINYPAADATKVTLCLLAPGKNSVYVRGDFSEWNVLPENQMKRDGEFFWLELYGLTGGEEYAYQYLVDETIWLADPYADKILDPDDQYIPAGTYPNLKTFPQDAYNSESKWYFNRLSVFQTAQEPYTWQVEDFVKPDKEKLVVYKLLIRDFFDDGDNHYQSLIDTISYFKRLGISAIELLPIMEFGGNNSWGYNPQFMFAPDKAYGTKNKLKEFVDVCHQNGIAVILDIALNHQDMPNPFLLQDFNFDTFKPNPTNRWFNVDATHPFNVFYDMNHESAYTKAYLDTVNYYWLSEYKIDGYRFDLSKGFTQVNNPNNVNAWSQYDATRVAILKRMADKIWQNFPDAYVILEHLSVNSEEKELAEYRAGEGKGMMLWGNLNYAYAQNAMGYADGSDISWIYHSNRNWTVPHVLGYMESHDEERMIFRTTTYGNSTVSYDIKDLNTGLNRAKAASTIFYTIPGPKMLWQFGELGYDYSINYCEDTGEISENCRTSPKPVKWEYQEEYNRSRLYAHISDLLRLRQEYDVFTNGEAILSSNSTLEKQLILKNSPYTGAPANANEMNAAVAVNFNVITKTIQVDFPHTGVWYDYYGYGAQLNVDVTPFPLQLKPGEFKLYTDVEITNPLITAVSDEFEKIISFYPNPVKSILKIDAGENIVELKMHSVLGMTSQPARLSETEWDVSGLQQGIYIGEAITHRGSFKVRIIKQ